MGDATTNRGGTPRAAGDAEGPLRILVVDDETDAAAGVAAALRLLGYEVATAADGVAALRDAEASLPDVILLDIGLPGMDGYEVAEQLLAKNLPKPPLIVAVTGRGGEEDRRRSAAAGIDLHLLKPVEAGLLHGILSRFKSFVTQGVPRGAAAP